MPRLYRPHIPLETRCRVVLRQLGEMFPDRVIEGARPKPGDAHLKGLGVHVSRQGFGALLAEKLEQYADLIACKVDELRLDHDPPLAQRPRERRGLGRVTYYTPDANDPEHLFYRPHGPQHDRSHLIKTNIRGDHGQHPDRVLIKKARKLERRKAAEKAAGKRKSPLALPKQGVPPSKRTTGPFPGQRGALSSAGATPKRTRIKVPVKNVSRVPAGAWAKRPVWRVDLACGHSISVQRESKPSKRTVRCKMCEARQPRIIHRTPMRGA